jgi:transcription-repair coupling factor (superfamily II helicase)
MKDLEIRGAGDLLEVVASGFINEIGLYLSENHE